MTSHHTQADWGDDVRVLTRAVDQAGDVLDQVHRDLLGHPTPCEGWDVAALADRTGFQYVVPSDGSGIAHAAGFMVATPHARLSRYFMGVAFEPRALRLALIEASNGRIGTLTERLALRCLHFDPSQGRYSLDILNGLRVMGLGLAAALTWWMWRHRAARVRSAA